MVAPCAVKPNCADVDLNEPCVFDYGILGRNMQHMQLKRWVIIMNSNLQAFQLIVLAGYLLGVPNPSPVSQHALT